MSCNDYVYKCDDCVDAWSIGLDYFCHTAPNPIQNLSDAQVGYCVEFNQGEERIWGRIIEVCSCGYIVEILTDLKSSHPFTKGDRVRIELVHVYNVDQYCQNIW
jgi:hypothetical protein